ncbi:MAG TPA: LpqB family beta-propeller domain-containing protein [Rudaea sp.]|nr:LpqB family beta-propeller domain-containing protein [Rudaea sp.]
MIRIAVVIPFALLASAAAATPEAPLTLERIMADPDWLGGRIDTADPEEGRAGPYFSIDGRSVYYRMKRRDSPIHDLHRIDLADGADHVIDAGGMAAAEGTPTYDAAGKRAAFVRNGDVFLRDLASGATLQVTRTEQTESSPQFSADGRLLSFRAGHDWFVYDIANAVAAPAAVLKTEKDPEAAPKPDDLRDLQFRLFTTIKKAHDDKHTAQEHAKSMQSGDPTRAPVPFYLGDDVQIVDTALSPDAHWLLAVTSPKAYDEGKKGKLTRYVTESGYEEFEDERTRVGRNDPVAHTLWLFDLAAHTSKKLGYDDLPGIHDDPLKAVREENEKAREKEKSAEQPAQTDAHGAAPAKSEKTKARELQVAGIAFSRDGSNVAVELRANDNKDRWIATLDFAKATLIPQHRLTDPAWINWNFNEFGWEHDNRTLWYVSEESGYAQLYTKALSGKAQALTHGKFEVSRPQLSADGRWFYVRANAQAPYAYDVYRVPTAGGELARVTRYGGMEGFVLAHDGTKLLVVHSSSYVPPQLAVVAADGSGEPHELTDTRSAEYKALQWVAPEIVEVPSTHFKGSVYAKFYKPADFDKSASHPAVLFVHGAGYTQNVHEQFPYYFREQMFHNLLLQHGYVVLDMDYRASEGYGREWRTAIYRNMGHPELEDLLDGKQWLVKNWNVDPKRVGIYGGSYGGFMTLMALFRAPGEFAAGAALRPVTDWTQYNDDYTSDILNRPQIDAIAYRRSSPLEFAEGLKDPLLICHGVIDDNVLFEDSMRLYERLIELHKDDFTISPYPLDRHGFTNADSWLDEYKRIYRLFETHLK